MMHKITSKLATVAGEQQFLAGLFINSIQAADICPKHRRNQTNAAAKFLEYMATRTPIQTWEEWLMSDHIGEYIDRLKEQGLSVNTLRSYANVFRLVNRTVFRKTRQPKAEVQSYLPKRRPNVSKNYLVLEKLKAAIHEARTQGNLRAELGFTLGGLMGLRLEEIAYICKADYREDEGTLFIYDSKNDYSTRTLPVPEAAKPVLRKAFAYREVVRRREDPRNCLYWNHEPISNAMRKITRTLYDKTADPAFDGRVKPMDARKTFRNTSSRPDAALNWWIVEAYMGHKLPGEGESYQHLRVTAACLPEIRHEALEMLRTVACQIDNMVLNCEIS